VTTLAWFVVPAAVLALAAGAWGVSRGAAAAGTWFALGVIGQAASLVLWKAGPLVGYQHFAPVGVFTVAQKIATVVLVAVVLTVVVGLGRHGRGFTDWLRSRQSLVAIAIALGAGLLVSSAPSADTARWMLELSLTAMVQLAAIACVGLAAASLPESVATSLGATLDGFLSGSAAAPLSRDRFAWTMAGLTTVAAALLALLSYQAHPHVPDEVAFLLQAKYFAHGMLWMQPPVVPAAFDTFCLDISGDRWFSVLQPGWPIVLAVGVRLGVPWLMNPVLGGLCVFLAFMLVADLGDRRTGRLAAVLLAVSPWHLTLSMSLMSHAFSLLLALGAALGTVRAWRTGSWVPGIAGGLALGFLGMSRPLEGVAIGLVTGLPLLVHAVRSRAIGGLGGFAVGSMISGGLGLAYNRLLTGTLLRFPAEPYFDRMYGVGRYGMGFGPEKGLGWTGLDPYPGHGPIDIVVNTVLNSFMINVDLFGWWTGSAAIVALGLLTARRGVERVMVWALASVVVLHGFYWFSGGPDFGARYWYLVIVPCVVLAIRGLGVLGQERDRAAGTLSPRALIATASLCVSGLFVFVPWRAADKYFHYREMRPDIRAFARDQRMAGALVLVQGERHPDWASAAAYNDVVPGSAGPVFAWDRDPEVRRELFRAYPDRPVWIVAGPSITHGAYRVTEGPVAPADRDRLPPPPAGPVSQ
jgi:hypothetical protein